MIQAEELQPDRCRIIAALACNPYENVELLQQLVLEARDSGADIVKLPGRINHSSSNDQAGLSLDDLESIIETVQGVEFLIAPYDLEVVERISLKKFYGWKIEPELLTHLKLLKATTSSHLALVAGVTGCTKLELNDALGQLSEDVVLLHTILPSESAVEISDVAHMVGLRSYGRRVGYADHSSDKEGALLAVALGATIIEKPLSFAGLKTESEKEKSLRPNEFRVFVEEIKKLESILMSNGLRNPLPDEMDLIEQDRFSIVASQMISRGTVLRANMLTLRKPGTGLAPRFLQIIEGHSTLYDIPKGAFITFGVID